MTDNTKYYYMRLKEGFFENDEILFLESLPDGYIYTNILLKLYLKSLKNNGKLMFNDQIPYNSQMLATLTRHSVHTVEKALKIFKELGLIEVLDNGAIYILDVQKYIGKSSTEAERKKAYRLEIDIEKENIEQKVKLDSEAKKERINYQIIADMYNKTCVSFPKITRLSEARKKAIKARMKKYSIEDFQKLFDMAEESNFLKGSNNRNWSANFDWLIKDANMAKVLEGQYRNRKYEYKENRSNEIDWENA